MKRLPQACVFLFLSFLLHLCAILLLHHIGPLDLRRMEAELAAKPVDYTPKQALADRYCVVTRRNDQYHVANEALLYRFIEKTQNGDPAVLKQAHFYNDAATLTSCHFDGEWYYLSIRDLYPLDRASRCQNRKYKNLFVLEEPGKSFRVILCSEDELTIEKLRRSSASSSLKDKFSFYPLYFVFVS